MDVSYMHKYIYEYLLGVRMNAYVCLNSAMCFLFRPGADYPSVGWDRKSISTGT